MCGWPGFTGDRATHGPRKFVHVAGWSAHAVTPGMGRSLPRRADRQERFTGSHRIGAQRCWIPDLTSGSVHRYGCGDVTPHVAALDRRSFSPGGSTCACADQSCLDPPGADPVGRGEDLRLGRHQLLGEVVEFPEGGVRAMSGGVHVGDGSRAGEADVVGGQRAQQGRGLQERRGTPGRIEVVAQAADLRGAGHGRNKRGAVPACHFTGAGLWTETDGQAVSVARRGLDDAGQRVLGWGHVQSKGAGHGTAQGRRPAAAVFTLPRRPNHERSGAAERRTRAADPP